VGLAAKQGNIFQFSIVPSFTAFVIEPRDEMRSEQAGTCRVTSAVSASSEPEAFRWPTKEKVMRLHLPTAIAAAFLFATAGIAAAQTVVIQPEQEVVIREYVKKKPLVSIDLPGVELNVGTRLSNEVELHAVEVPDVNYQYVVVGGRTVLVDPGTREIIHVMD
jgi:hypothetical protein